MNISIGGDHAGYEYKEEIITLLSELGHSIIDHGPFSTDSVDYPDFVKPVARDVISGLSDLGIVICGSGNGVAMTANKFAEIRAALCWKAELAELARSHNNANVLALPARFIDLDSAKEMVKIFLETDFEGGRHQRRVEKISCN